MIDESTLRRAVEEGHLVLHYQPKISLETDRIVGAEALLRWEDPERGLVHPLDFVPLAEASGLIVPIGAWAIREVCRQAVRWKDDFGRFPPLVLAANVSGLQLRRDLVDTVVTALRDANAEPSLLCLEVTESALIVDAEGAIKTLRALADLGVKLSIDDFGTGYSSLSYLKRLPLHELKVDKSFVDGIGHDPDDTAIVAATVAMAHALELSVVAEGVERLDQLERLRTIGCQEAQGFLFSEPHPPDALSDLMAAGVGSWATTRPTTGTERVLVVDDAADVRQLASMTLSTIGLEVHEAADGEAGLAMARQIRPDCVILDVSMPGLSGSEVCIALRSQPATAESTIIMLTSSTTADDKVEAFSCGADDYIIKPFTPRDLVGRVRAAMRRRALAAG